MCLPGKITKQCVCSRQTVTTMNRHLFSPLVLIVLNLLGLAFRKKESKFRVFSTAYSIFLLILSFSRTMSLIFNDIVPILVATYTTSGKLEIFFPAVSSTDVNCQLLHQIHIFKKFKPRHLFMYKLRKNSSQFNSSAKNFAGKGDVLFVKH